MNELNIGACTPACSIATNIPYAYGKQKIISRQVSIALATLCGTGLICELNAAVIYLRGLQVKLVAVRHRISTCDISACVPGSLDDPRTTTRQHCRQLVIKLTDYSG